MDTFNTFRYLGSLNNFTLHSQMWWFVYHHWKELVSSWLGLRKVLSHLNRIWFIPFAGYKVEYQIWRQFFGLWLVVRKYQCSKMANILLGIDLSFSSSFYYGYKLRFICNYLDITFECGFIQRCSLYLAHQFINIPLKKKISTDLKEESLVTSDVPCGILKWMYIARKKI